MLPAALVTLVTYLLEFCSSSPVYNMQPAFITNTVGSTAGRNIRNLPCISRRNSNQSGFCMFAIDCLKANGTHLGTCIDGFYFGSCCHIEPVRDIIDNNIDSDIIPHREPPFRISSTTMRSISTTSMLKSESTTRTTLSSSTTTKSSSNKSTTSLPITIAGSSRPVTSSTVSISKFTTSTPSTTVSEKLQTFQVVESNTLQDISTKAPVVTTSQHVSSRPITKEPVSASTHRPATVEPVLILTSKQPNTQKPINLSTSPTTTTTNSPKPVQITNSTTTTAKVRTTTTTTRPLFSDSTSKPTKISSKTTKAPTKITYKPTKLTSKPSLATKKPQNTTKASTTTKPIKYTGPTSKPTKRVTTTQRSTTSKFTTTKSTTTDKLVTRPIVTSTTTSNSVTSSSTPKLTSTHPVSSSTPLVSTTESSNSLGKINVTVILDAANGNTSTNEIEETHDHFTDAATQPSTSKPGLITWTVADNRNFTTSSPKPTFNVTTEDWVPITTPDGWVLLPSVPSNLTTAIAQESSSLSTPSSTTLSTNTPTLFPITLPTPFSKPSIITNATTESTTSSSSSTSGENSTFSSSSESTEATSVESSSVSSMPAVDNFDRPVNMSDFTDVCGRRMYPEARIVGGEKSSFGKWPWQISLRQWRTSTYLHKCGAALLNENWAITAAHCVDNVPPSDLLLRLGEHDLSTESEPYLHQERRVQIVASHPQFDPRTFEYDLALLRFYEPVNFQPNILPVCVPQTNETFVGKTAFVTGWGRLYEDGPLPSILQEVSVPVINNTVCESMYRSAGYIEHIPHIFICAGWRRGGFDSCEGDSGGPMVIQRQDNRFLLAGVISWGIGCAEPNQPGVYTRISEFRDWINQILQF